MNGLHLALTVPYALIAAWVYVGTAVWGVVWIREIRHMRNRQTGPVSWAKFVVCWVGCWFAWPYMAYAWFTDFVRSGGILWGPRRGFYG